MHTTITFRNPHLIQDLTTHTSLRLSPVIIADPTSIMCPDTSTPHRTTFVPHLPNSLHPSSTHRVSTSPRTFTRTTKRTTRSVVRSVRANPNQVLTPDQLQEWNQVSALLQQIDPTLQLTQADKLVGRAFGWGTQKFWRGDVKEEPPSLDSAEETVQFLREAISLDDAAIAAIIKSFPEVLRLTVTKMGENVTYIQKNYPNIKGQLLVNTIKATPAVLGYDYDCEGDCQSECARCWVQF